MFDKRLLWTGGAIIATVLIAFFLTGYPDMPEAESEAGIGAYGQQDIEKQEEAPDYAYLIKEHEGRIAVFVPGKSDPEITFDVMVKFLPDYDREQMRNGIPVKDYKELSRIIEDYIS